jgi:hypothetical protein
MVQNLQRVWAARIDSPSTSNQSRLGWTAVGVSIQEGRQCNGVLLPVNDDELRAFDIREKHYKRMLVDWNLIRKFEGGLLDDATIQSSDVWVYAQQSTNLANRYFPIPQTYVDVILRGCLSISDEFCTSFVETTQGWWYEPNESSDLMMDTPEAIEEATYTGEEKKIDQGGSLQWDIKDHLVWIDDRIVPAYHRNDRTMLEWSDNNSRIVDDILRRHAPDAFDKRRKVN